MIQLEFRLFGQFNLQYAGQEILIPSRPAQSLLAYLVLNTGVNHRREKLAGLQWPDTTETNARGYLRKALWLIRKSFEDASAPWQDYLRIDEISLSFERTSDYWLDADLITQHKDQQDWTIDDLVSVVSVFQGELLPGFYEEWAVLERERHQLAYHQKMNLLLERLIQSGQWDEALRWGEQWILLDYSPEPAFRALMIAYAGQGEQGMVGATYQRCVDALDRDLGLEPSHETRRLFQQLVSGEPYLTYLVPTEQETISILEEPPVPGSAPYKGLKYFDIGDANLFFGREKLTAQLAGRLREGERLLFVVGASGSGKSSLVRAGLIPALKSGKQLIDSFYPPEGSPDWLLYVIQPTAQPLVTLASALWHDDPSLLNMTTIVEDLQQDSRSLYLYANHLCQSHAAARLLLVVDQFEELFTLCQDAVQREIFIDNLLAAVDPDASGPTIVVITLRADFYAHCAHYPKLRQLLAAHQEYIGPMSSGELRRAIEEPARQGAWEFEPGLVDLILRDVRGQPGSLPLLSHALLETWRRRRGRSLTLKSYAESGSVQGAIAHTAETVYQQELNGSQQVVARQIFLRLTELGEDAPETRRRAQVTELLSNVDQRPVVEAVLEKLVEARLVTVSEDYAEVTHEALIREWPTLRHWLEKDRQGFKLHRQLTEAALTWESMERDESVLYRGARLANALEWSQGHRGEVNILEQDFLEASRDLVERRQREREKQIRRLRWLAASLVGILILALFSAVYAFNQRSVAQREAHLATSRQLAAAALNNLEADPELGILLALEAVSEAQSAGLPVPKEAQEALHQSLQASRLELVIAAHPAGVREIDYSPDGKAIASVGKDRTLKIWDTHTGQLLNSARASNVEITHIAYSPDGEHIATSDHDLSVKIWDSQTLALVASLDGHESGVMTLAYNPDGDRLVTSSMSPWEGEYVWDTSTDQIIGILPGDVTVPETISFSPNGDWIAAANLDGKVSLWNSTTFNEISSLGNGESMMFGLAFSPDGSRLAASDAGGKVTIWDVSNWDELLTFYAHAGWIIDIEFSPDGTRLATSSLDGLAKVWDASTGQELLQLAGHMDGILSLAFDPSGKHVATGSMDGTIRLWNVSISQEWLSFPTDGYAGKIAFSPDGSLLAAGYGNQGEIHILDLETRKEPVIFSSTGHPDGVKAVAFSPNGLQLASTGMDNSLKIWDVDTGQLINTKEELAYNGIYDIDYSPDGSQLVIGGDSYLFELLDAATLQKSFEFLNRGVVDGLDFSPDGSQLASTTRVGVVKLWDLEKGEESQNFDVSTDWIRDVAFDPGGESLALAGDDGTAIIWHLGETEPMLTLHGHSAPVTGVAYSPEGNRIATASQDGTACLWDAATGEELLLLNPENGAGLVDIAFSPDGKYLATSGDDATRVFLLDIGDLVSLAKKRVSRDFTLQECQRFFSAKRCESLVTPTPVTKTGDQFEAAGRICAFTDQIGITKFGSYYHTYLGAKQAAEHHDWDMNIFVPELYEAFSQEFQRTLDAECDLIVSLGFTIKDVVEENAIQHPEQRFLFLDDYFDPPLENVRTVTYTSDQGAFLAGYLAAAMTQTGTIGTFGGAKVPAVTDFMIGFESGMEYYNHKYGAEIQLLGWDSIANEGFFANFMDDGAGYEYAQRLLEQDADIIFPVAGSVTGYGALLAVSEVEKAYLIGVDLDYLELYPQFADVLLTSVMKRYDVSVMLAADALAAGDFVGGNHRGTLKSGEVALAPFHDLEAIIPDHIKADLDEIKEDIIAGNIQTKPEELVKER